MATTMVSCGANLGFASSLRTKTVGASKSEIAGVTDAFANLRAGSSCREESRPATVVTPVAKRVCDLTGKKRHNGYKVSFSNSRSKHVQEANLQYKRLWWEQGKRFVRLKVCTKALKTIELKGLDKMARDAGIDLTKF